MPLSDSLNSCSTRRIKVGTRTAIHPSRKKPAYERRAAWRVSP